MTALSSLSSMSTDIPLGKQLSDLHNFFAEDAAKFFKAAAEGDLVAFETLTIQHGIPINLRDKTDGTQAIHLVCAGGGGSKLLEFIVEAFHKRYPEEPLSTILDAKDNEGFTPLMTCAASTHDRVDETTFLLQRGANVYARNNYGGTCLHIAAVQSNSIEATKRILTHCKFDPKLINGARRDGFTPLILAVYYKNVNVARFLITEANADCNLKTNVGETALHVACARSGMMSVIRLLIEQGRASPNARDDAGSTALHAAASENLLDVVEYLCQHGATLFLDNHRRSPYDFAKQNNNAVIADLLKDYAIRRKTEMLQQQQQQQLQNNNHQQQGKSRPTTPLPAAQGVASTTTPTTPQQPNSHSHNASTATEAMMNSSSNNNLSASNNNLAAAGKTRSPTRPVGIRRKSPIQINTTTTNNNFLHDQYTLTVPNSGGTHSNNASRPNTPKAVSPIDTIPNANSASFTSSCPNCIAGARNVQELMMAKFEQERKQWKAQVDYLKQKAEKAENDSKREIERLHEVIEGANNARKFETRLLQEEINKIKNNPK